MGFSFGLLNGIVLSKSPKFSTFFSFYVKYVMFIHGRGNVEILECKAFLLK